MTLVDGGVFTNLDLGEAIVRCREEVDNDEDIIIDVVLCISDPIQIAEWTMADAKSKSAYSYATRKKEMKDYYYYFEDVARVIRGYPNIGFRHLITPS